MVERLLSSHSLVAARTEPHLSPPLESHYAYSVAPIDGGSLLFTGESARWYSYRKSIGTPQ